jgi:hypothetical protein
MTPRARTARQRRPAAPEFHEGQLLNWGSSRHWNYTGPAACRYCERPAFLLDSKGHPAHKVCAEAALATQYAEAIAEYRGQTL